MKGCEQGAPLTCDDSNVCTLDLCKKDVGCVHPWKPPQTACDDTLACTTADACDGKGNCVGNPQTGGGCCKIPADCDDGYACTVANCDSATHKTQAGMVFGWLLGVFLIDFWAKLGAKLDQGWHQH